MTAALNSPNFVRESMWFDTDLETAFRGWIEKDAIESWFGPPGYRAKVLELDPQPGGDWRFLMVPDHGEPTHHNGTYVELSFPNRLVFTWESEEEKHLTQGRETLVTITFDEEKGGVRVTILHEQLPDQQAVQALSFGWSQGIAKLERWIRGAKT